jgi:hypothetical protein
MEISKSEILEVVSGPPLLSRRRGGRGKPLPHLFAMIESILMSCFNKIVGAAFSRDFHFVGPRCCGPCGFAPSIEAL